MIFTKQLQDRGGEVPGLKKKAWMMIVLMLFSFALAILYQGMRGVLYLGGFVASGGPYAIAHPAPEWIWVVPLAALLLVGTMLAGLFLGASGSGSFYLMLLAWPALFLSLGWNFLDFGLGLGGKGGLAWGWLICAFFFFLMAVVPLWIILKHYFRKLRQRLEKETYLSQFFDLAVQLLVAGGAVFLGVIFFRSLL